MSILAECPICRRKQSAKNKLCKCGENLDKAKRSKKVRYWINYRLPGGKQRREPVSFSIEEARAAEGKRRSQKRENRIFDMLPKSKATFDELTEWYLGLSKVKKLADYNGTKIRLNNFNKVFGDETVYTIKPIHIESYQTGRQSQGIRNTTIDLELNTIKIMINKAFDNDMVDGRTLKAFRNVKNISKKAEWTRNRTLTIKEYLKLLDNAALHLKGMLIVLFNTGMRPGEVKGLKWSYIDRKAMLIRLPADFTKEKAPKDIPINRHVKAVLDSAPRAINHDFVFTYKGSPVKLKGGPSEAFQTACKRARIPYGLKIKDGIVMKDFRRTFKTNMLKAGVDRVYRDKIVGHSLRGMDIHYIVVGVDDLHNAMDKFTKWLDSEIKNVDQNVDQKFQSI
jgi:integrase